MLPTTLQVSPTGIAPSAKAEEILARIDESELRSQVREAISLALAALADLGRIHLPQDHFEEQAKSRPTSDKHLELAPYVLGALAKINTLLSFLSDRFPPGADAGQQEMDEDDFDLEFDLVDGPIGEGSGLSGTAAAADRSQRDLVLDSANAYGSMLRSRVLQCAERLRHAVQQEDNWPLLAELDDQQHRLIKAVQGVLFGLLGDFGDDARREEILPAYRSALGDSVMLRTAITELSFHVNRFNQALADASAEQAVPLVVGVADRLTSFASRPAYGALRAEDKKAVMDFRKVLFDLRHNPDGVARGPLCRAVEGFSKFLESMQAINHREVLVLHDRQRLEGALASLEGIAADAERDPAAATQALDAVVASLNAVLGRSPVLDDSLRAHKKDGVEPTSVGQALVHWRDVLQGTVGMVG